VLQRFLNPDSLVVPFQKIPAAAIRAARFAREKLCFLNADWLRRLAVWLAIFDVLTITTHDCFPKKITFARN
jgi:hypothetical protein